MIAGETQVPSAHEKLGAQAAPHEPQFFGSDCVLTQTPLHAVWLAVHAEGAAHVPLVQTCPGEASALPQLVPSGALGFEHVPVDGLQLPAAWHVSSAVHVTGLVPVHVPFWHESLCVHPLPSLHVAPFAAVGLEHAPVVESHVPGRWHWSEAVQMTGLDPAHAPALHS
jgi:hypothetical protein